MAEVTGMSAVHASRMWSELISDGLISFDNGCVAIEDEQRMVALSGFTERASRPRLQLDPMTTRTCRKRSAAVRSSDPSEYRPRAEGECPQPFE